MENSFKNTLRVYPNPTKEAIKVELGSNYDKVSVRIRNLIGQTVFEQSYRNSKAVQLNIPGKAGMYFIEVRFGEKKSIVKVLKE